MEFYEIGPNHYLEVLLLLIRCSLLIPMLVGVL